jgi:predicted AAA+ superfamily ATPase
MNDITQRLRKIRQSCDLGPLTGSDLDTYWVDTDDARDPLRSVRDNLRQRLEDREDTKILFYGHGGSGKSTELNKLVKELDGEYLVVNFSVREEMSLTDVNSEDIILVLMERLVATAADATLDVDTEALEGINDYFSTITETQREENKQAIGVTGQSHKGNA